MDFDTNSFSAIVQLPVNKADVKPWETPVGKDCIDFGSTLAKFMGIRLQFLAEHTHTYPPQYEHQYWVNELRMHGEILEAYAMAQACGYHHDDMLRDAKASIEWVAEHLNHLWD